jgi:hypothetical protein
VNSNFDNYQDYREAVNQLRLSITSLDDFSDILKHDPRLKRLRSRARGDLQAIYDNVARDFELVQLPVYMPVRKKISVFGVAFHANGVPSEIRIYTIKGCSNKPYDKWTPRDVACYTPSEVFETFIHETAHVLEASRTGRMGHAKPFIKAYENIEEYFFNQGFEHLIDPEIRLTGVPRKLVRR